MTERQDKITTYRRLQRPEELRRKQVKAKRRGIYTEEDIDVFCISVLLGRLITPFGIINFKTYERFHESR
jgi:hypothetical protein